MTKGIPLSGMFWLSPTTGSLRVFPGQVQAEVSFQGEVCLSVLIQPHAPQAKIKLLIFPARAALEKLSMP